MESKKNTYHRSHGHPEPYVPKIPYHHQAKKPSSEIYLIMKEEGIRRMIIQFYSALKQSAISPMFERRSFDEAVDRSAKYFCQLLGGPPLYQKKYGPPKLRARHLPFVISESSRQIWLSTFYDVLEHPKGFTFPREHLEEFKEFLNTFSRWMVNHHDDSYP
ncbi:MAG: hypothetical protein OXC40_02435 [Proteobacteria bacterium]|nr:hypothetical protein [Pseudomonadota bacterium]